MRQGRLKKQIGQALGLALLCGSPAYADQSLEDGLRQFHELAKQVPSSQWKWREEKPLVVRCMVCGPIFGLSQSVNRALRQIAEKEGSRELKDRVEILDRLNSTVLYSSGDSPCPDSNGLRFFHHIDDERLELVFATNIEMRDVQTLHFQDPKQNVSFFRARYDGRPVIIRFDQRSDGTANVFFFRETELELPDLSGGPAPAVSPIPGSSESQETGGGASRHQVTGMKMKWRRNGLPERLIVFDYQGEGGGLDGFRWKQAATMSSSGLYGEFKLQGEGGREVMRLRSKGSAESTEVEVPSFIHASNGSVIAETNVVASSHTTGASVRPTRTGYGGSRDSYGITVADGGRDRSAHYTRDFKDGAKITLRLRKAPGGVGPWNTGDYSESVFVEYRRNW